MFRRSLIAGLSMGAIAAGICGLAGIYFSVFGQFRLSSGLFGYVHFADGLTRLYWFGVDQDANLDISPDGRLVAIRRASDGRSCLVYRHGTPGAVSSYGAYWRENRIGRPNPPANVRMTGFRMPVHAVVGLLLIYPVLTVGRQRWRMHRRPGEGMCEQCGYNLHGNRTGICPECGDPVRCRGCGYVWSGPPEGSCPDCGRAFFAT